MAGFRNYTISLDAGQEYSLPVPSSNYVRCTGGDIDFTIIDSGSNSPVTLRKGMGFSFETKFDSLRVVNGGSPQTIELFIGSGEVFDSRLSAEGGSFQRANRIVAESVVSIPSNSIPTTILNDNPNRSRALIYNSGTIEVYVSSLPTLNSASVGMLIPSGGYFEITHNKPVYAIRGAGAPTTCIVMEESN